MYELQLRSNRTRDAHAHHPIMEIVDACSCTLLKLMYKQVISTNPRVPELRKYRHSVDFCLDVVDTQAYCTMPAWYFACTPQTCKRFIMALDMAKITVCFQI